MEELQRLLQDFKNQIQATENNVKTLKDNPVAMVCGREIAVTVTKLQEARAWMQYALEETGKQNVASIQGQGQQQPQS